MSWSLEVRNGDFTLSNAHLGTVTSVGKLVQDLRHYILEKMGTDDLHPGYGSLLDGGRTPDGVEATPIIGTTNMNAAAAMIESELRRIVAAYQRTQLDRAKSDRQIYGKTTLTGGEVVSNLAGIAFQQNMDTIDAVLEIQTLSGQTQFLTIPLSTSSVFTR